MSGSLSVNTTQQPTASPSPTSVSKTPDLMGTVWQHPPLAGNEPPTPTVPVDENRRPKHLSQWSNADVIKWLKRHCEHFYEQYGDKFLAHQITGRSLCRVTDSMLERMGIEPQEHRDELRRIIMKLKLKSDMVKLKDLERT